MKVDVTIRPLGKKDDVEEKDMFYMKISSYKEKIEGRFEKSELRHLIQKIDNAI